MGMMLVCPTCRTGLSAPPVLPAPTSTPTHWLPATPLAPSGVQPPYVCGWMFQTSEKRHMMGCPCHHSPCMVMCCLPCPHTCQGPSPPKLACPAQDPRISCLHKSGGGLVEGHKASLHTPSLCSFITAITPPPQHSTNPFFSCTPVVPAPAPPPVVPVPSPPPLSSPPEIYDDSTVLAATRRELEESGWYYGAVTWQEAAALLKSSAVGTFLVRDSSSPQCLYSLSVQTTRGPTSVRLHYAKGKFSLECAGASVNAGIKQTPEFPSVVGLLQHYTKLASSQVWVDHDGHTFSSIDIRQPLRRTPSPLQHLCRLVLNKTPASSGLPPALATFLKDYPHTV